LQRNTTPQNPRRKKKFAGDAERNTRRNILTQTTENGAERKTIHLETHRDYHDQIQKKAAARRPVVKVKFARQNLPPAADEDGPLRHNKSVATAAEKPGERSAESNDVAKAAELGAWDEARVDAEKEAKVAAEQQSEVEAGDEDKVAGENNNKKKSLMLILPMVYDQRSQVVNMGSKERFQMLRRYMSF
jgi:hypothetical protein